MDVIDLRSDTVSWPTPAMRQAMANAVVGDDVWGDDPTVIRLEEMAAECMGKEAALFVPSGTMGNLAAALVHCNRGDEVILGDKSHTFRWEAGGLASLGGIQPYILPNQPDGTLELTAIEEAVRADNPHFPRSRAIFLENTHNNCGGAAIPQDYVRAVREIADRRGLLLHLDGARLFNAIAALGCPVTAMTQYADSVTFCLSKGLCAPVGSLLCGSREFIHQARRARKALGGGMRQVGILAAAGIVALEQMVERLVEDHVHAGLLASGLAELPGVRVDLPPIPTNIVFFYLGEETPIGPEELVARMEAEYGVKIGQIKGRLMRVVTHYWITDEGAQTALRGFRALLK